MLFLNSVPRLCLGSLRTCLCWIHTFFSGREFYGSVGGGGGGLHILTCFQWSQNLKFSAGGHLIAVGLCPPLNNPWIQHLDLLYGGYLGRSGLLVQDEMMKVITFQSLLIMEKTFTKKFEKKFNFLKFLTYAEIFS